MQLCHCASCSWAPYSVSFSLYSVLQFCYDFILIMCEECIMQHKMSTALWWPLFRHAVLNLMLFIYSRGQRVGNEHLPYVSYGTMKLCVGKTVHKNQKTEEWQLLTLKPQHVHLLTILQNFSEKGQEQDDAGEPSNRVWSNAVTSSRSRLQTNDDGTAIVAWSQWHCSPGNNSSLLPKAQGQQLQLQPVDLQHKLKWKERSAHFVIWLAAL